MAGLIALGAELCALSLRQSGADSSKYFRFLRSLKAGTVIRCADHPRITYKLEREDRRNGTAPEFLKARRLKIEHEQFVFIGQSTCLKWWPDEDLPENAGGFDGMSLPTEAGTLRSLLPPGAEICDDRLRMNCDDVVFIGPPGGVPAFRTIYEDHCSIGSGQGDSYYPLSTLLGLRGWTTTGVAHASRGVFINALSPGAVSAAKLAARKAVLAVFDGAAAFLKLGDYFCRCDRIVVACRSLSNNVLERLCSKLYQDQHDTGAVAENGSSWLTNLPPAIQGYRSREPRREAHT